LKNRCNWRMAEGFSKKNSVRGADWAVMTYNHAMLLQPTARSERRPTIENG
jgi:hypothetical protein